MGAQRAGQLVEAGLWLRLSGDTEGARRLFEQALKLDPANARARQLLESRQVTQAPAAIPETAPDLQKTQPGWPNPLVRKGPQLPNADEVDWGTGGNFTPRENRPLAPEEVARAMELEQQGFVENATSAWDSSSEPGLHISQIGPDTGSAMDLVLSDQAVATGTLTNKGEPAEDAVDSEIAALLRGARELLELDDHSGAMDLILKAQELAPNDPEVQRMRDRSEKTLQAMFESKLGSLDVRPKVSLKDDEIIWLNLDHRAGFVLAQIDGTVSFEDLFAVSGMSRLDTARILAQLVEEGVVRV